MAGGGALAGSWMWLALAGVEEVERGVWLNSSGEADDLTHQTGDVMIFFQYGDCQVEAVLAALFLSWMLAV
ncbi:hypothetical protein GCM10017673_57950 [Streptosporangium violaceochromogenes]|nr:hypothetical protein GCM10017673_57950 [Streptosporangium violaceochromogenes]